jgi:hypothetical protein
MPTMRCRSAFRTDRDRRTLIKSSDPADERRST